VHALQDHERLTYITEAVVTETKHTTTTHVRLLQHSLTIGATTAVQSMCYWVFTRSDRRTDRSVRPMLRPTVCQTIRTDRSGRL